MMRSTPCGRSSVVERQLPKLYVEGSIPFARSILLSLRDWNCAVSSINDPSLVAETHGKPLSRHIGHALWFATGLAVVGAGLILWSARGERVFSDLVSATISWCL